MRWQLVTNSEVFVVLFRTRQQPKGRLISAMKLVGGTSEERKAELEKNRPDSDQIVRDGDEIYCLTCAIS